VRRVISLSLIICLGSGLMKADERSIKMSSRLKPYIAFNNDTRIYIRNDDVVIRTEDLAAGKVIITEDFDLIVNRDTLELNEDQQALVFEYYQLVDESIESAKNIGWEGAKVGVSGAAIGVKAVVGVFRMILPNYGPDDLERDMEAEAARIEAKADILEKKAEIIDEKLDKLESIHETLKQDIPELKNLDWF
jgi:hypothetical protein